MDEWMDDLRFYVLFNNISVISGRWADDNKRFCAMEPCLRLRRFRLERGSNPDSGCGSSCVGFCQNLFIFTAPGVVP